MMSAPTEESAPNAAEPEIVSEQKDEQQQNISPEPAPATGPAPYKTVPKKSFNPCSCCVCKLRTNCIVIAVILFTFGGFEFVQFVNLRDTQKCMAGDSDCEKLNGLAISFFSFIIEFGSLSCLSAIFLLCAVLGRWSWCAVVSAILLFVSAISYIVEGTVDYVLLDHGRVKGSIRNIFDIGTLKSVIITRLLIIAPLYIYFGICAMGLFTQIKAGVDLLRMRFGQISFDPSDPYQRIDMGGGYGGGYYGQRMGAGVGATVVTVPSGGNTGNQGTTNVVVVNQQQPPHYGGYGYGYGYRPYGYGYGYGSSWW